MKILMISRNTLYTSRGGDTTQIEMTAKYLRTLGVEIDVRLTNESIDYSKYDLIHFFNIIRPDDILPHIQKSNLPYVVSTIFVDYSEYEIKCRRGLLGLFSKIFSEHQLEYIKAIARFVFNGQRISSLYYLTHGHKSSIRKIAKGASLLLPNSRSEYERFSIKYRLSCVYKKIVNAIDPSIFNDQAEADVKYKDHILCVGRIEGRKNQLNLIKALMNTDFKLTIIGKSSPNHLKYLQKCQQLASQTNNIQIIEHIEHTELVSIYKAAKVHVLPSWFETTGLSSLEAGVMNCNIVVTKKGDTEEYFKDLAYYCKPDEPESIRKAINDAFNAPVNPELRKIILQNYTWQNTAQQTLSAYNTVIKGIQ